MEVIYVTKLSYKYRKKTTSVTSTCSVILIVAIAYIYCFLLYTVKKLQE